jgi:hypothetical protein
VPAWLWITIAVAVAGAALLFLWQSAGRSRLDRTNPNLRSANERFETDVNRMRTMRHDGF